MQQAHHAAFILKWTCLNDGAAEHFDQSAPNGVDDHTQQNAGKGLWTNVRDKGQHGKSQPGSDLGDDDALSVSDPVHKLCTKKIHDQLRYIKRERNEGNIRISYPIGPAERQEKQRHKISGYRLRDESKITRKFCPVIVFDFLHGTYTPSAFILSIYSKKTLYCSLPDIVICDT